MAARRPPSPRQGQILRPPPSRSRQPTRPPSHPLTRLLHLLAAPQPARSLIPLPVHPPIPPLTPPHILTQPPRRTPLPLRLHRRRAIQLRTRQPTRLPIL